VEGSEDFDVIKDVENSELVVNELKVERKEDRVELFTKTIVFENSVEVYKKEISEKIYIRKISEEEKNSIIAEKSGILGNKNILNSEYRMTDSLKSGNISTVIVDNNEHNKKIFAKTNKKLDNNIRTISKRIIERSLFYYLNEKFDANVPWGILTGIRPVKIVQELLDDGLEIEDIRENMKKQYLIRDEKLDLITDIALRERPFIYPVTDKKISLYVSVPFCPTRCLYCSFPSHPLEKFGSYRHEYVETVLKEAEGVADIIEKQGKEIETLYIGGGTPTALEAEDLEYLIQGLFERLDLSNIKEFTVEAGRPDSITREKLEALKRNNVSRISINPQTMNQETLDFVGRKHSVEDIKDCFILARELGFDNINMDLILGLPGENLEMVENTMKEIVSLNPESVTVHTLALKRASDLNINMESYKDALIGYQTVIDMISLSRKYMDEYGYNPYYMYRQKHMLGNLENIGYAKEGYECLYNMQIMEEKQSNYAIGAGAVSKFVYLDENRIERVDDVKNLQVYLERVDDMILKKYREVEKNGN